MVVAGSDVDPVLFHNLAVNPLGATAFDQAVEVLQEQWSLIADIPLERLLRAIRLLGQVTFRHDTPDALPLELALVECTLGQSPVTPQPLPEPPEVNPTCPELMSAAFS